MLSHVCHFGAFCFMRQLVNMVWLCGGTTRAHRTCMYCKLEEVDEDEISMV